MQVKPQHPSNTPIPVIQPDVTWTLRRFHVGSLPESYPYDIADFQDAWRIKVPFREFRGADDPLADTGHPGDVYIKLTPRTLYAKVTSGWVEWNPLPGIRLPQIPPKDQIIHHPHFENQDRFLWCNGRVVSWFTRPSIGIARKKMRKAGMYENRGGNTSGTATAVASEIIRRMLEFEKDCAPSPATVGTKRKLVEPPRTEGLAIKKPKRTTKANPVSHSTLHSNALGLSFLLGVGLSDLPFDEGRTPEAPKIGSAFYRIHLHKPPQSTQTSSTPGPCQDNSSKALSDRFPIPGNGEPDDTAVAPITSVPAANLPQPQILTHEQLLEEDVRRLRSAILRVIEKAKEHGERHALEKKAQDCENQRLVKLVGELTAEKQMLSEKASDILLGDVRTHARTRVRRSRYFQLIKNPYFFGRRPLCRNGRTK